MLDPVALDLEGGVATLRLQSPENRNALSSTVRRRLGEHLDAVIDDPDVRAIELTGAGRVFCSGADMKEGPLEGPGIPTLVSLLQRISDAPKPVICVVNGPARAGGVGLVATCDIALSVDTATFAFSEVRIGVVPAIISISCLDRLTSRAAARYYLTGDPFTAEEAVAAGLLTAAVSEGELAGARASLLESLSLGEPAAMAGAKQLLREIPLLPRDVAFGYTERMSADFFASEAAAEGRAAFLEKRRPAWAPPG